MRVSAGDRAHTPCPLVCQSVRPIKCLCHPAPVGVAVLPDAGPQTAPLGRPGCGGVARVLRLAVAMGKRCADQRGLLGRSLKFCPDPAQP